MNNVTEILHYILLPVLFSVATFFFVRNCFLYRYQLYKKGKIEGKMWSPEDVFQPREDVIVMTKDPNKDFVVLVLTDIQVNHPYSFDEDRIIFHTVKKAVERTKPDLIALLGDNAWANTRQCYARLVSFMDGFRIPWTTVFGNHDWEGNADPAYLAEILKTSKYCLFRPGPKNVTGLGNYAINICENEKVIYTLFFFDSGTWKYEYDPSRIKYLEADENVREKMPAFYAERQDDKIQIGGMWGTLAFEQIDWYRWILNGIRENNGGVLPRSSILMHIPLYEYNDAFFQWMKNGCDPDTGTGEINEKISSAALSTGMFDAIKECGSTENVIVGHDHENSFSGLYQGIRLSYGLKCGDECSWREYASGGSTLSVNENGEGTFAHVVIAPEGKRHDEK